VYNIAQILICKVTICFRKKKYNAYVLNRALDPNIFNKIMISVSCMRTTMTDTQSLGNHGKNYPVRNSNLRFNKTSKDRAV
jgi:hypothetical protein